MSVPPPVEKLTLAYRELFDIDVRIAQQFGPTLKQLDLSNNNLRDLTALKAFTKLETLVLDNNAINSHTKFPKLENLHTLWVNSNQISNLILFIDKLVDSTPNLKFLSMLKNEACPNYFNGKSLKEYADYRLYVTCRLQSLTCLDSTEITEQERSDAKKLYSSLPLPSKPTAPSDDLRTIIKKPAPVPDKKQKRKKKKSTLPTFNNEGAPMGPPPTVAGEGEDESSSDFSSEGGIDSEEWTDEEVEEDNTIIEDTHVMPNPPQKR